MIAPHQKFFALFVSIAILVLILEMIRRRKIKEEYSWLWFLVGVSMIVLVLRFDLLMWLSHLIGAESPITTIFLFGFIFLILINLDYSVRISTHKEQIKKLAQKIGLLSKEIDDLKK